MTPFLSPESQWDSISSKDRPCKGKTDIIVEKPARFHPADEGQLSVTFCACHILLHLW